MGNPQAVFNEAIRQAELRGVRAGLEAAALIPQERADNAYQRWLVVAKIPGSHGLDNLEESGSLRAVADAIRAIDPESVPCPSENR